MVEKEMNMIKHTSAEKGEEISMEMPMTKGIMTGIITRKIQAIIEKKP